MAVELCVFIHFSSKCSIACPSVRAVRPVFCINWGDVKRLLYSILPISSVLKVFQITCVNTAVTGITFGNVIPTLPVWSPHLDNPKLVSKRNERIRAFLFVDIWVIEKQYSIRTHTPLSLYSLKLFQNSRLLLGLLCTEITAGWYRIYTFTDTLCRGLINDSLSTA